MTDNEKINLKNDVIKIAEHYGFENQYKKLLEEMAELAEAGLDCKRSPTKGNRKHMKEEIADVRVMLDQMAYFLNDDGEDGGEIEEIMRYKVDRQLKRMEEEG